MAGTGHRTHERDRTARAVLQRRRRHRAVPGVGSRHQRGVDPGATPSSGPSWSPSGPPPSAGAPVTPSPTTTGMLPTLAWRLTKGDITTKLDGSYVFDAAGSGTEITYHLEVELRVPIPGFIKMRAQSRIMTTALRDLKAGSKQRRDRSRDRHPRVRVALGPDPGRRHRGHQDPGGGHSTPPDSWSPRPGCPPPIPRPPTPRTPTPRPQSDVPGAAVADAVGQVVAQLDPAGGSAGPAPVGVGTFPGCSTIGDSWCLRPTCRAPSVRVWPTCWRPACRAAR